MRGPKFTHQLFCPPEVSFEAQHARAEKLTRDGNPDDNLVFVHAHSSRVPMCTPNCVIYPKPVDTDSPPV